LPPPRAAETLLSADAAAAGRAAVDAARWRPGLVGALVIRMAQDDGWRVRQAIAQALATAPARTVLPALASRLGEDGDSDVQRACAASLEKHLVALGGYPAPLARPAAPALGQRHHR